MTSLISSYTEHSTVTEIWKYWINWWENISGIKILKKSSVLNECIIFGFQVIQMLYAKYYIYIQHLYHNNKLDLFSYLSQLKYAMEVEYKVCKSQNNENDIYEV